MPDEVLTWEHGEVRLGSTRIDGELSYLSVCGEVEFDEAQEDGLSGTKKTAMGWKDANISISMYLTSDEDGTCYDRLREIDALFRGGDEGQKPQVYTITNAHACARGIDQVVFSELSSYETNRDDMLQITMTFVEYEPAVVQTETKAAASDVATETPTTSKTADAETLKIALD